MRKFIVTDNHKMICGALDAQKKAIGNFLPIAVISGEFGTGKTESLNHLSAQEGYFLVTCYKGIAHRALLCRIAESMELVPYGTIAELTDQIIAFWECSSVPLLVDEADFIIPGGLVEVVRGIADEASAPLCLSGMGKFENSLKKFPHILDRSPEPDFRVRLRPLTNDIVKRIVEEYSVVSWDNDALAFLLGNQRGKYRGTIHAIGKVDAIAQRSGISTVTGELMEDIFG